MEDNSFTYFTQDEVLSKMDIDPRLVEVFKYVMNSIQKHFNEKGYTKDRDYKAFLERNLLKDGKRHIRIYVDENMREEVGGEYNRYYSTLRINSNKFDGPKGNLYRSFCHEFIHFLVLHEISYKDSELSIINGGFINEALTELLAREIVPDAYNASYESQVEMHKFANLISGNKNNFRMFLLGKIDAKYCSAAWLNYVNSVDAFQRDFDKDTQKYIRLYGAQHNINYINAQREIINLYINPHAIKNIEEYIDNITKLMKRPVKDYEYINSIIEKIDNFLIHNLGVHDKDLEAVLKGQLIKLRELLKQLNQGTILKIGGTEVTVYEDMHIEGLMPGMVSFTDSRSGNVEIVSDDSKIKININDIKTNKKEIINQIVNISKYFTKEYIENYSMLKKSVEQRGKLLKIEKFTLPNIDLTYTKRSREIYVATYENKIVVLNNTEKLDEVENIPLYEYLGNTSSNINNTLINQEQIGNIGKGIVYTYLSNKQVYNKAIYSFSDDISNVISDGQLQEAIEEYKKSTLYDKNDTEEDIRLNSIDMLARNNFDSLNHNLRKKYFDEVKDKHEKFIVTMNNGIVDVGIMHGIVSYKANRELLYDINNNEKYNVIVDELYKCNIEKDIIDSIEIDNNGNIMNSKDIDNRHRVLINKVERLLGITISHSSNYIESTFNNFPRIVSKNKEELVNEEREIIRSLNRLKANNTLSIQEYEMLRNAITKEYNSMIKNVNKKVIDEENETQKKL